MRFNSGFKGLIQSNSSRCPDAAYFPASHQLLLFWNFESPVRFYPFTLRAVTSDTFPSSDWSDNEKGVYFRRLTNLNFSEVKLKFPWERNAHNAAESPIFLYRKKPLICQHECRTEFPDLLFSQYSGSCHDWTRVKAGGWTDRNPFLQRVVRQGLC